jgi:hypothetical protein
VWHLLCRQRRVLAAMVQRGLGDRRVLMDTHKVVALSGVVVSSTTVGLAKVNAWISSEVGTVEDGGGGFWNMRMRCA